MKTKVIFVPEIKNTNSNTNVIVKTLSIATSKKEEKKNIILVDAGVFK